MYINQWLKQRISLGIVNRRLEIQDLEKNSMLLGVTDLLGQQTPSDRGFGHAFPMGSREFCCPAPPGL